jgi:hypothetical protein
MKVDFKERLKSIIRAKNSNYVIDKIFDLNLVNITNLQRILIRERVNEIISNNKDINLMDAITDVAQEFNVSEASVKLAYYQK